MGARHLLAVALALLTACGDDAPALRRASARQPTADEAQRLSAAQQLLLADRPDDVAAVLAPALAGPSPLPHAQFFAGWAAYQLQDYGRSAELLGAALEVLPPSDWTWWRGLRVLGFARHKLGDYDGAAATFRRALELDLDVPAELPAEGLALERCRMHYGLGLAELTRGELAPAREHLTRALELVPDYLQAQKAWADLLFEEGADAEALAAVDALLARWPVNEDALHLRAQLLVRLGREQEAEAALARWREVFDARAQLSSLQSSVATGADTPETWLLSAELFLRLGDLRQAREALQTGLNRHPGHPELEAQLAALAPRR